MANQPQQREKKTRSRKEIVALSKLKIKQIELLKRELVKLDKEWCMLSDRKQQYKEEIRIVTERVGRKTTNTKRLVGSIHWKEKFKDEDTGKFITINRQRIVKVDGVWKI